MSLNIIISTIAFLIIIEGFLIALFPKVSRKVFTRLAKKSTSLRWFGIIELVIGIFLLVLSVIVNLN